MSVHCTDISSTYLQKWLYIVQPFLLCFCARMMWGRILNWISQHLEDFDPCYFRQFHECIFFSLSFNCVGAQCSKTLRRACGWWRQGPTKLWIAVHDVVSTRSLLKLLNFLCPITSRSLLEPYCLSFLII